jgi:hypothetical protein
LAEIQSTVPQFHSQLWSPHVFYLVESTLGLIKRHTMMLRATTGLRCTRRVPRFNPLTMRNNSSHSHHDEESHQPHDKGYVGDGSVRNLPSVNMLIMTGLMSPGILRSMALIGGFYLLYLYDRRVADRNNGVGIIKAFGNKVWQEGEDPMVTKALMEEKRQALMQHFEMSQRPIVRLSHPEYFS